MTKRALGRLLGVYVIVLVVSVFVVRTHVRLGDPAARIVVESHWKAGKLVSRRTHETEQAEPDPDPNVRVASERVVAEGPLSLDPLRFGLALVSGRDGIRAELAGKTAWLTVDDLLAAQAYDHGGTFIDASLGIGTNRTLVLALLAERLGTSTRDVATNAKVTRVRFERIAPPSPRITGESLNPAIVTTAIHDAALYLARGVDAEGRFRYIVTAPTNQTIAGYNWPRHAGATYFLAQAAALFDDATLRYAALRAAAKMRDDTMTDCGENRCIAAEDDADVGSSALGLVAFAKIVETNADPSYRRVVSDLAKFLRAQQRPDGELMHFYRRSEHKAIDVQLLYYTGEAALALARAHAITGDPADLDASKRALAHLVGPGWSFFGSRYYFSEEHWTCQTMSDLWERAPSEDALEFCLRWHRYQRALQHEDGDSPFDADGAFGFGPFLSPRVTPASSRGEAAGATLDAVRKSRPRDPEVLALESELDRSIAFVMRQQFRPGPSYLFADPEAVRGAFPGSPVDWQLRIDYAQHAGSMMIRWLDLRRQSLKN